MRLLSVSLKNYRLHRELSVSLDAALTVIGGPNETGKSTFAEAVHRALFLKARITGETQRQMVSTHHPDHPEVEVRFAARGRTYRIHKRFSGANGTALLTEEGGASWRGDEAETRLAELLGVESVSGGRGAGERAAQQWSHLWVRQGQAGDDPSEPANAQRDPLLARLQTTGGAAVMQSERDARVAAIFQARVEAMFNRNGSPKKDSELGRALREAEAAEATLTQARESLDQLQQAIRDFAAAAETIHAAEEDLITLVTQQKTLEARLKQVGELRAREAAETAGVQAARTKHDDLAKAHRQIARLAADIAQHADTLKPQTAELRKLEAAAAERQRQAAEAEQRHQQAVEEVTATRRRHELATARVAHFEKTAAHEQLLARAAKVREARAQLEDCETKRSRLPNVSASRLKKLRALDHERATAEAALEAMAARLEVTAADLEVRADDTPLAPGESRVLTEPAEIRVGDGVRLRIIPGGGAGLTEARQRVQDAQQQLAVQLDDLGVTALEQAVEAETRRQQLAAEIKAIRANLAGLGADTLDETLQEAAHARTAAEEELARRLALVEAPEPVANLAEAEAQVVRAREALETAETDEQAARTARDAAAREHRKAADRLATVQANGEAFTRKLADLQAQHRLLETSHGATNARAARLERLRGELREAEAKLTATRQALDKLQPDLLEADQARLERALAQTRNRKNEAEQTQAVARSRLLSDGATDPHAALALAEARADEARERLNQVRHRTEALRHLHELFVQEQQALSEQFTRPLAERISGYLQCLFGPQARAEVFLENNAFTGLRLIRPEHGPEAFAFDRLSGGTREQVAAAVRLAMAEILAGDHDGCLPLVFDDAFAYADPERVQTLQRMLDLAATRGLQIIILTCNPADYATLGARQFTLPTNGVSQ